jgi:lysozyme
MKKLLLLLLLSPVILLGQERQKAIVDSIRANATDLQGISKLLSTNPRIKPGQIQISDSGEYVTITVRVHVEDEGIITPIDAVRIARMKTRDITAGKMSAVTVPEVIEVDMSTPMPVLSITKLNTGKISAAKLNPVIVPLLPEGALYGLEPLSFIEDRELSIKNHPAAKLRVVIVPSLPEGGLYGLEALSLFAYHELPVKIRRKGKMDTLVVPVYEEKKMTVDEMHLSDEGYSLLEKLEGFSPTLYSLGDGGFTIGFGFFIPYSEGPAWRKGLTLAEAETMIREKVPAYEDQVKQYINVPLTQTEFDALTLLAYNLGGFSKATSIVNDVNMQAGFDKLQQDWMRFVHSKAPGVLKGLMNRRKDEIKVRNESDYQAERKLQILNTSKQ